MSTHHLLLAKEFYERASLDAKASSPFAAGFAMSALQDAVEMCLYACGAHWGVKAERDFDIQVTALFSAARTRGEDLGSEAPLKALNKARVGFKHHGNLPDLREVERQRDIVGAFLTTASRTVFGLEISELSEVDLVTVQPVKDLLNQAHQALIAGEIATAQVRCADALDELRNFEGALGQTGVVVQYQDVPAPILDAIRLHVGNLGLQVARVREIAFAALFGVNLIDLRMLAEVLPRKQGNVYSWSNERGKNVTMANVRRCIHVLVRYALAVEKIWNSGASLDWDPE